MKTCTMLKLRKMASDSGTNQAYNQAQCAEYVPASVARGMMEALTRLADGEDSPTVPELGCGVEDRDLQDNAYEAAEYAWQEAEERFMEWVKNEANAALAAAEVE